MEVTEQAYRDHLQRIANAVMTVDVQDGCEEGRKQFIRDHLGDEYVPNTESLKYVVLLAVETKNSVDGMGVKSGIELAIDYYLAEESDYDEGFNSDFRSISVVEVLTKQQAEELLGAS